MLKPWVLLLGLAACELAGPDNFYPTLIDDQAVRADGSTVQYIYRADGPLVARRVTCAEAAANCVSEHRVYIYDGLQLRSETSLAGGQRALVAKYYYAEEGDIPVAVDLNQGGQMVRYDYVVDRQGSVIGLLNGQGQWVERVTYDPWGQPVIEPADTQAPRLVAVEGRPNGALWLVFSEPVLPPAVVPAEGFATTLSPLSAAVTVSQNNANLEGEFALLEAAANHPRGTVIAFAPSAPLNPTVPVRVELTEGGLQDDWGNQIAALNQAVTWSQGTLYSTGAAPGSTRTFPVARSTVGNHVLFQAHLYDEDIGIYLMRARVYDPRTGQFLQRDPIPFVDGINVYAGMANDPINYRDPTGELLIFLTAALKTAAINALKMVALGLGIDVGLQLIRIAESDQLTLAHFDYHSLWKTAAYSAVGGPLLGKAAMFSPLVPRAVGVVGAALGIGAASQDFADGNPITGSIEAALGVAAFRSASNWSRPCKCFTEDTEVWTPSGLVPIAQIKAGDKVNCTAPDGEWGTCAVIAPYSREYFGEMVALTVAGETIQVTGGHPFWVEEGQNLAFRPIIGELGTETFVAGAKGRWVEAKNVLVGDQVRLGDDQVAAVDEIAAWSEVLTVYNLTVEGEHTFAVGEPGVLVHNCITDLEPDLDLSVTTGFYKMLLDAARLMKRPVQVHHFATNKGKVWAPRMKKIADRYGLDLDGTWNKEAMRHAGRHPADYHKFVESGMKRDAHEAGDDVNKFRCR